jgi:hypothetical protein
MPTAIVKFQVNQRMHNCGKHNNFGRVAHLGTPKLVFIVPVRSNFCSERLKKPLSSQHCSLNMSLHDGTPTPQLSPDPRLEDDGSYVIYVTRRFTLAVEESRTSSSTATRLCV